MIIFSGKYRIRRIQTLIVFNSFETLIQIQRNHKGTFISMRRKTKPISKAEEISHIPFSQCFAKTWIKEDGSVCLGRDVFDHCRIVGQVAKKLLENMPVFVRKAIFPEGSELIAACHDLGKVSPTFFLKIMKAAGQNWENQYHIPDNLQGLYKNENKMWGGHAGVSALTLENAGYSKAIQIIAGQHHGSMPPVRGKDATGKNFGGEIWQQERIKLIAALKQALKSDFPTETLSDPQILALSGLTSVADWIGSGSLFDNPAIDGEPFIDTALQQAGYIPFSLNEGLSFKDIFSFKPRTIQSELIAACKTPGVYILEAPMGLGKTEAALYTAYKMLEQKQATGIYFALPTQMTSNKMYERFNQFLEKILAQDCPHRKALLLHSNAWLATTELGVEGEPGNSWFNNSKRGLLAPFSVGTLDQALMAAMHVRHGFVRAFGLAGKVVILDEIHSYDAYTGMILDALVTLLSELQCTVIILSATLDQTRRNMLLGKDATSTSCAYPLITAKLTNTNINTNVKDHVQEIAVPPPPSKNTAITFVDVDEQSQKAAVEEALRRAENKQQVLWIENTVKEAQERYYDFATRCHELGIQCALLHSRFTPADRQHNEDKWVDALGKNGWKQRPDCGRIIIGTQVLEQSLDIDADFLISQFAPSDMLIQRLGRLWRHEENNKLRPQGAQREAWIIAPAIDQAIKSPDTNFGVSALVYSSYVLCRSLQAWQEHLQQSNNVVCLPDDIHCLIDATYADRTEKEERMQTHKKDLFEGTRHKKGVNALHQLARSTLTKAGSILPDIEAQTRYSETDNGQILLLKSIHTDSETETTHLRLLSGETVIVPWKKHKKRKKQWREISAQLMRQMVPCRENQLPNAHHYQRLKKIGFENILYLGNKTSDTAELFAIAIVEGGGSMSGFEQQLSDEYLYRYRKDIGLEAIKLNKK